MLKKAGYWIGCVLLIVSIFALFFGVVPTLSAMGLISYDVLLSALFVGTGFFMSYAAIFKPRWLDASFLQKPSSSFVSTPYRVFVTMLGLSLLVGGALYNVSHSARSIVVSFFVGSICIQVIRIAFTVAHKANWGLEFHDSNLTNIETKESTVVLFFSEAVLHKSAGRPGWDPGSSWLQPARITVTNGRLNTKMPQLPGWISDGSIRCDAETFDFLNLPFDKAGNIRLELSISGTGESVAITGQAIRVDLEGSPRFDADFPGSGGPRD